MSFSVFDHFNWQSNIIVLEKSAFIDYTYVLLLERERERERERNFLCHSNYTK